MLCYPFEEKRLKKHTIWLVQPKLDGIRCRVVWIAENTPLLVSSTNCVISSVPHITNALRELPDYYKKMELDGELYHHGMPFEDIESITSRTVNLHPDYESIEFHCFDVVNSNPQIARLVEIQHISHHSGYVKAVKWNNCYSLTDIMHEFNENISLGYEGIVARAYNGTYVRKRSTEVMKFKPKKRDSYLITGWKEEKAEDGTPKGTLGALMCKSDNEYFSVGSGFTQKERQELWNDKDKLPGNYAVIAYQHTTPRRGVPRFPIFVSVSGRKEE
jgi:DNA ligase-1